MSLRCVQSFSIQMAVQAALDRLDRGTVIFESGGGASVQCKKHKSWVGVSYDNVRLHDEKTILDYLIEAFDRCPGCIEEKQWAATRFPENAEL